jgi:hypothetical protein
MATVTGSSAAPVRVLKRTLSAIFDRRPGPSTRDERESLTDLREAFLAFPVYGVADVPPSEASWRANMERLRQLVLEDDPRRFLRWDVVSRSMFAGNAPYAWPELRFLRSLPDWKATVAPAIRESRVGHPVPYAFYPASSGNLIHHAYHLARFEEATRSRIGDVASVVEFGGGYGSMCRLFFNRGFRGKYIILDLPPFSALQTYYLRTLGLPVVPVGAFGNADAEVACVSEVEQIRPLLPGHPWERSIFLATWSLSEIPVAARNSVLPLVRASSSVLIGYQERFEEVDNSGYFKRWQEVDGSVDWCSLPIAHLPGNNYLFGVRREAG